MNSNPAPMVNILLSTYNGERFIVEQLDSLLNQTYPNIRIYIRDDGSTDRTVDLINSHSINAKPISVTLGDNIGAIPSFLELLANSGNNGDLFAFCDQDDVWKPEKISRAVDKIIERPNPDNALYCSRLEYVDENLAHLGYSPVPRLAGFANAVVENIATGCTVVIGNTIRQLLLKGKPNAMLMHDWWAYLIASVFGEVIYDEIPSIQYRRHGNTVTAWEPGLIKLRSRVNGVIRRLIYRNQRGTDSLNQAIRFLETYPGIPNDAKEIVTTLHKLREEGTILQRACYATHPKVLRTDPLENIGLKIMILLGLY